MSAADVWGSQHDLEVVVREFSSGCCHLIEVTHGSQSVVSRTETLSAFRYLRKAQILGSWRRLLLDGVRAQQWCSTLDLLKDASVLRVLKKVAHCN